VMIVVCRVSYTATRGGAAGYPMDDGIIVPTQQRAEYGCAGGTTPNHCDMAHKLPQT
jgi:hypothetical protein